MYIEKYRIVLFRKFVVYIVLEMEQKTTYKHETLENGQRQVYLGHVIKRSHGIRQLYIA